MPFLGTLNIGGSSNAPAIYSSSTGSPTITNFTGNGSNGGVSGVVYDVYKFTGSGSITFSRAGYVDVLVVGGGASGGDANRGGDGGACISTNEYVTASTYTIIVGGGGGGYGAPGGHSRVSPDLVAGSGTAPTGGAQGRGNCGALSPGLSYSSLITGASTSWALGGGAATFTAGAANTGNGGGGTGGGGAAAGGSGIVIVRVAR